MADAYVLAGERPPCCHWRHCRPEFLAAAGRGGKYPDSAGPCHAQWGTVKGFATTTPATVGWTTAERTGFWKKATSRITRRATPATTKPL